MNASSHRPERAAGIAFVACGAVLWGTAGVASKVLFGLGDAAPQTLGFYRLVVASLVLLVAARLTLGVGCFAIQRGDWIALALIGLAQAAYQGLYFGAVERIGVTLSTLIALCSSPVLVTLLAALAFKEIPSGRTLAAITIAVAGVVLLIGFPDGVTNEVATFWTGAAMAAVAALAYAVFALASWKLAADYHPFVLVGLGFGFGAMLLAPFAWQAGLAVDGGQKAWAVVGFVGLISTALAYVLFYRGLKHVRASASGVLVLLEPLTAALLASVLFGEILTVPGLAGAALLLLAAALIALSNARRERK
jgi:DME family drug/metabolite transporter